jgi:hypothetical protein
MKMRIAAILAVCVAAVTPALSQDRARFHREQNGWLFDARAYHDARVPWLSRQRIRDDDRQR